MAVRNENRIDTIELVLLRVFRISIRPWIHDEDLAGIQTELKRGMTKPGNLEHSHDPLCFGFLVARLAVTAGFAGREAGNWMPSPIFAIPGLVTGRWPEI